MNFEVNLTGASGGDILERIVMSKSVGSVGYDYISDKSMLDCYLDSWDWCILVRESYRILIQFLNLNL